MTKTIKSIYVGLSLLAAFSLAACGDTKKSPTSSSGAEQARQFLISNMQAYAQGNAAQFCKSEVDFIGVDAKGNLEQVGDNLSKLLSDEFKGCLASAKTDPFPKTTQDKAEALKQADKVVNELRTAQIIISPDGNVATVQVSDGNKLRALKLNGDWYRYVGPGLNKATD